MGTLNKIGVLHGGRFGDHPLNNTPELVGGSSTHWYSALASNAANVNAYSWFKVWDKGSAPAAGTDQPHFFYRMAKGAIETIMPVAYSGDASFGLLPTDAYYFGATTDGGLGTNTGPSAEVTVDIFTDGN